MRWRFMWDDDSLILGIGHALFNEVVSSL